jgi:hypothetical protein
LISVYNTAILPTVGMAFAEHDEEVEQQHLADPCRVGHRALLSRRGGHRSSFRRGVRLSFSSTLARVGNPQPNRGRRAGDVSSPDPGDSALTVASHHELRGAAIGSRGWRGFWLLGLLASSETRRAESAWFTNDGEPPNSPLAIKFGREARERPWIRGKLLLYGCFFCLCPVCEAGLFRRGD